MSGQNWPYQQLQNRHDHEVHVIGWLSYCGTLRHWQLTSHLLFHLLNEDNTNFTDAVLSLNMSVPFSSPVFPWPPLRCCHLCWLQKHITPSSWIVASIKRQWVHLCFFGTPTNSACGMTAQKCMQEIPKLSKLLWKCYVFSANISNCGNFLFFITLKQSYSETFQMLSWEKRTQNVKTWQLSTCGWKQKTTWSELYIK